MAQFFIGVPQRVAEIQDHPFTGVHFVPLYNFFFDVAANPDDFLHLGEQFLTTVAAFQQLEKLFVANHPVFDDFGKAVKKDAVAEGSKGFRVDEDPLWLVKNASQVFPLL